MCLTSGYPIAPMRNSASDTENSTSKMASTNDFAFLEETYENSIAPKSLSVDSLLKFFRVLLNDGTVRKHHRVTERTYRMSADLITQIRN